MAEMAAQVAPGGDEVTRFEEFFTTFYYKDMLTAAAKSKKSFTIDFAMLDKFDPALADKLLNDPTALLDAAREAVHAIDLPEGVVALEPRFKNLPETAKVRIRNLRSEHIGKFVVLDGIVRRTSEVRPEIREATFECIECANKIIIVQNERILKRPLVCSNCGHRGPWGNPVDKKLHDARWVTVQEPFEVATTEQPGETTIYLKDDLTSPEMQRKCDPGNRLLITGIVKELKRLNKGQMRTQLDIYVDVNHVEPTEIEWEEVVISEEDEAELKKMAADPQIYTRLIQSMAPAIYGLEEIKESILLQMFGGIIHKLPDGTRIRGDIHVLLLGDPSVAKTQLLKLVAQIMPRAKYVSGRGTSAAGLTATVIKDEEIAGGWVLEAGAMPLCHRSMISIDEFDKVSKEDQVALHEAMESQTISIAKASIVATLPSQVAVLAGANPKFSRFDPYKPIVEQIDIPDTLLSRFDLKFALRDMPNPEMDAKLATHILETRLQPNTVEPPIKPLLMRKFIAYVRKHANPEMTREAAERLKQFYLEMRGLYSGETVVAITLRQNEALLRLAEASAKIRLADKVGIADAERAIRIMKYSIMQLGYDIETGKIDIDRTEGTPASQRTKIHTILDIIARLEKQFGKQVPRVEIITAAEDEGIRDTDAEELLSRLKREGMIFEPRRDHVQKI